MGDEKNCPVSQIEFDLLREAVNQRFKDVEDKRVLAYNSMELRLSELLDRIVTTDKLDAAIAKAAVVVIALAGVMFGVLEFFLKK